MLKPHRRRRGFTLVELLVVIAIIGVLMALTLPAVQSVREKSRVTQCQNNMTQLWKASEGYKAQFRAMVSGGWSQNWIGQPPYQLEKQPGGWIFQCLPFIEETSLATMDATNGSPNGNQQRAAAVLTFLYCPSRRPATAIAFPGPAAPTLINVTGVTVAGRSDYAGCSGSGTPAVCVCSSANAPSSLTATFNNWMDPTTMNGVIVQRRGMRPNDIVDGESRTYMFGEKAIAANQVDQGRDGDAYPPLTGFGNSIIRTTTNSMQSDSENATNAASSCAFGSAHPIGSNFMFCDGRVVMQDSGINATVYQYLGDRNDKQILNEADYMR